MLLLEEKAIDDEIQRLIDETVAVIEERKSYGQAFRGELLSSEMYSYVLIAREEIGLEPSQRLSGVVKRALEFLEFKVVDIDATIKSVIKKEDFWALHNNL